MRDVAVEMERFFQELGVACYAQGQELLRGQGGCSLVRFLRVIRRAHGDKQSPKVWAEENAFIRTVGCRFTSPSVATSHGNWTIVDFIVSFLGFADSSLLIAHSESPRTCESRTQ